jgi:ribosome biogenesis GTPase
VESRGYRCTVLGEDGTEQACRVHSATPPIVPGDYVVMEKGLVTGVEPRRTMLSRRDPYVKTKQLPIVANIDLVGIVVSCVSPPLHPRLIDRYLAAIWRGGAEPFITMNKTDLHESGPGLEEDRAKLNPYRDMGIPVFEMSVHEEHGSAALAEHLRGKVAVFVGHSGVGKSTLVNSLIESAHASTGATSDYSTKGRHTTTASTLHQEGDIRIIDTPGVREFGIDFASPAEIAECFRDFPAGCRFSDCIHLHEDGCKVRDEVARGGLSAARYDSYRRLVADAFPETAHPPDAGFTCRHCGVDVVMQGGGTQHRNHCPRCLHSVHLDVVPGDRLALCGGLMEPVSVWVRKGDEWAIIHRCRKCGRFGSNRIAADDNELLLMSLAVKPLSSPPFPLDRMRV